MLALAEDGVHRLSPISASLSRTLCSSAFVSPPAMAQMTCSCSGARRRRSRGAFFVRLIFVLTGKHQVIEHAHVRRQPRFPASRRLYEFAQAHFRRPLEHLSVLLSGQTHRRTVAPSHRRVVTTPYGFTVRVTKTLDTPTYWVPVPKLQTAQSSLQNACQGSAPYIPSRDAGCGR